GGGAWQGQARTGAAAESGAAGCLRGDPCRRPRRVGWRGRQPARVCVRAADLRAAAPCGNHANGYDRGVGGAAASAAAAGGPACCSGSGLDCHCPVHDYAFWERQWAKYETSGNLIALRDIADEAPRIFANQARARIAEIEAAQKLQAEERERQTRERAAAEQR